MLESENILLRRFAATGDAEAFAEVVRRHVGLVYGASLRVLALVHAEPAKLEKIKTWLLRNQIPFSSGVVGEKYETGLWKVQSLPSLALTDAEHLLIARGFGPDELDEKLKKSGHAER
ncbi:MAG: hypothetical protein KAY65_02550 [Planctomycetes bacterium]|nr:hypothetical protein [Planctomycetota bacterium]